MHIVFSGAVSCGTIVVVVTIMADSREGEHGKDFEERQSILP